MKQIILDLETQKTFDEVGGYFPEQLGVSYVGICQRNHWHDGGQLSGFLEHELGQLFPLLEEADVIIGFNIDNFDLPALSPYYHGDLSKLPTLDLMLQIKKSAGHRISLDACAQATIKQKKSGNGLDAIRYYQQKDFTSLANYCLQDVKVTRDLCDYGRSHGEVKFYNKWNRLVTCPVDFNFKAPTSTGTQFSLF